PLLVYLPSSRPAFLQARKSVSTIPSTLLSRHSVRRLSNSARQVGSAGRGGETVAFGVVTLVHMLNLALLFGFQLHPLVASRFNVLRKGPARNERRAGLRSRRRIGAWSAIRTSRPTGLPGTERC